MKSELRHLLDKLKAEIPNFQSINISGSGRSYAVHRFGAVPFDSLDQLETWLYLPAPTAPLEHEQCECQACLKLRASASSEKSPIINRQSSIIDPSAPSDPATAGLAATAQEFHTYP